jgi:hypothetical protein
MNFDLSTLISLLGKDVMSSEVQEALKNYPFPDVHESPPFRRYYLAEQKGVDLLSENDRIIDIQIFVQATKSHSAYDCILPYGIHPGMDQEAVHKRLGEPVEYSEFDSKYEMLESFCRKLCFEFLN